MTNIIEKVKTFEDAQALTGRPNVPEFLELPEDLREYFKAHYKMAVIAEALNEGRKLDWEDPNQKKWFPWFRVSSGAFVFDDTNYYYSSADAGDASRLCFSSSELARYAGEQFIEIWEIIIKK
ncbi:MAG: hypothetical protein FWC34_10995 [Bacteroidetes bacterium]|nr:hypothetical protein [Bacteroidota bacterium]MCL2302932.1 hypothetical protein [Lentimicrobiaceae bacterium]